MLQTPHRTNPWDRETHANIASSHPGQAHFGGTGPAGKTCRECLHFWDIRYYAKSNRKHGPTLKPAKCEKYKCLTGDYGPDIPHNALACKFFEKRETFLPIKDPSV